MERLKKLLNPLYLLTIILAIIMFNFVKEQKKDADLFFGFASNNETQINLDYPVKVNKIFIKSGDYIKQGVRLAELFQINLDKEIMDENNRIDQLSSKHLSVKHKLEREIEILNSENQSDLKNIANKIDELELAHAEKQNLFAELKSLEIKENKNAEHYYQIQKQQLENQRASIINTYESKISLKKQALKDQNNIYSAEVQKHMGDVEFAENKLKKLDLECPTDALVGNVHIEAGEYVEPFETMFTLYEANPTAVSGFVHESMMVSVKVGDKFDVGSVQNVDYKCEGVVTGLGSRIVEIPERLRKVPQFKTYGREVFIQIPRNNSFLQKEKVVIYFRNDSSTE